ncbi:MAG: hypothetical protein AAF696_01615 [Bacteroidota bacterium]
MIRLTTTFWGLLPTRQFLLSIFLTLSIVLPLYGETENNGGNIATEVSVFAQIPKLRYQYPDSSLALLDQAYEKFISEGDTVSAIKTQLLYANINGNLANYKDAYDKLWKALSLADEAGLEKEKAILYIEIGRYYSFYKKRNKALEYFQISLEINQALLKRGEIHPAKLVDNYYAFVSTYRELDDFPLAKKHLDSCFYYFDPIQSPIKKIYLEFESACISRAEGKYAEALASFDKNQAWFEKNAPTYLVLFYTYKGEALQGLHRLDESEDYYLKALQISREYNMHIDFSPIVHEKLSELYIQKGNYQAAFASLKNAKDLDAAFFDSRSAKNRSLLEIQDAFRMEQKSQQELIKEQKLERLEHEKDVWFLQRVIGVVSILFIICLSYLYFSYIRANYRAEKEILRKEKELELANANEVLEVKNRELAASALKLIEKDENLTLLKNKIKEADGNLKPNELKKIVRSISVSNDHNWKEFETRFVAVNKGFYDNMRKAFPKLSQKDLKLCALIKLNFSCKEMAKLLGISVESAHTSRYRLRKKLNLTRDVNLTEFIAKI